MQPVDMNSLRQMLVARSMAGQGGTGYQNNPMRVQPMQALPGGAPNIPGQPPMPMPNPPAPSPVNMGQRPGGATPMQQTAKAAQQAQSPMLDQGTRDVAKALVSKLLQHM